MPLGLQPTHLILIFVVALLIFGPSRLPELGRTIGATWREFQSVSKQATEGFREDPTPPVARKEEPPSTPCMSCGRPVQQGMKFCPECGTTQASVPCKSCSEPVQVGVKFCPKCGAAQL